jgi:hypothetical protein
MMRQRAEAESICSECLGDLRFMKCPRCWGKGVKGILSKHACGECGGTGTMTLCLNTRCSRFDKRLVGWFAAQR